MRKSMGLGLALGILVIGVAATAQESEVTRPDLLLRAIVEGMPLGEKQEVRVFSASFKPGEKTVVHTHRFPVTVYVLEGTFTLEVGGSQPVTVHAGQAMVEPPRKTMTGYNRSSTDPLRVVIFYVSDPDTPFLGLLD